MASIKKKVLKDGSESYQITVLVGRDSEDKQIFERCTYKPEMLTPSGIRKKDSVIEKDVQAYATAFEKRVKEGKVYRGERISFQEFALETWKPDWAEFHLTLRVREDYEDNLRLHVLPKIGMLKLSKITPAHCQNIITGLTKQGLSPKSVRATNTAMNSVFKYAYRLSIIEENPCGRCELPKTKADSELHYFTIEQCNRFLNDACEREYEFTYQAHSSKQRTTKKVQAVREYSTMHAIGYNWKVFFTLAIVGGFRRGELCALTWEDIDALNHTININKSLSKSKSGQIIKEPKTKKGIRLLSMPQGIFDLLIALKEEQKRTCDSLPDVWEGFTGKEFDRNYVFTTSTGACMNLDTPTHKFKEVLAYYNNAINKESLKLREQGYIAEADRKLGELLPEIRLHDLRHTSATLLLSEGVDILTVSHRLGHSRPSITLDVYSHSLASKDLIASQKLSQVFAIRM